jgi:hypothetical protein
MRKLKFAEGGIRLPSRYESQPRERISVDFLEASIEIGFRLVDLAEEACLRGHLDEAARSLIDADQVLEDIKQRMERLEIWAARPFGPLVGELKRAIGLAKTHAEGTAGVTA